MPCRLRQARKAALRVAVSCLPGADATVDVETAAGDARVVGVVDNVGDAFGVEIVVTTPLPPEIVVRLPPSFVGITAMSMLVRFD